MAQSIGFFQFDNLVRGRVGFVFVNLGIDTAAVYPHIFKMHLDHMMLQLPEGTLATASDEQILSALQQQPKESAVIVLDQNGARAEKIAGQLDALGFLNAFYLKGGWEQLLKDRA